MILRFRSGSSTSASFPRNRSLASTRTTLTPSCSPSVDMTASDSPLRQQSVIHKDGGQLISYRPMDQCGSHG